MKSKKCFKCGENKLLSEFYRHSQMADGHVNKCKHCNKMDVRQNRHDRVEYYREYDRKRGGRQTDEYRQKYKEAYPLKARARSAVGNAVRDGRLCKSSECETCGSTFAIHGHHDDYSKPLEVRWLCATCHHQWHAKNGEGLNAA